MGAVGRVFLVHKGLLAIVVSGCEWAEVGGSQAMGEGCRHAYTRQSAVGRAFGQGGSRLGVNVMSGQCDSGRGGRGLMRNGQPEHVLR